MRDSKVWVVRDKDGKVIGAGESYYTATREALQASRINSIQGVRLQDAAEDGSSVIVLGGGVSMAHDTIRDPAVRETERRVLEAARAFAEAKTACRDAWVASGTVPPSLTNTLDKATDNLLSADSALRAVLDPPIPSPPIIP
ncbi:hypothetical protein [Gemmatimonas sp.]